MDKLPKKRRYSERLTTLKGIRSSWDKTNREIARFIEPRRFRDEADKTNRGEKQNSVIINNTGTQAVRTLASGMQAGVTSPARPWFRLSTPDPALNEASTVKQWLYTIQQRMEQLFNRSNLYNILPSVYADLGMFSTAALMQLEDNEDHIRFYHFPMGSYCIANSTRLTTDTFYREYKSTVGQLVERFGKDNVSKQVQALFDNHKYDQTIDCVHVIEPRYERDDRKLDRLNMAYRSAYYEAGGGDDKLLGEGGFQEFPVYAPRWETVGEDAYGSMGPAYNALGDIKGLQLEEKRKYEAIDKMVNPPMTGPSSLKNMKTTTLPGGLTTVDVQHQNQGFRPTYEVNPRVQELMLDIEKTEDRIRRSFYEDLFLMLANDRRSNVTAREITERHEEKMLMLGPVLERVHAELLDPMIARTFGIMARRGMIPPPPPEMQGVEIKVEYVSVLAQAQQMVGLAPIERLIGFAGSAAQMDPSVLDKIDFDQAVDRYSEMAGGPPDIVRSDEVVAGIRQQRADAQRQAQQMEQAQAMAQSASAATTAAKNLSETAMNEDSALAALTGQ